MNYTTELYNHTLKIFHEFVGDVCSYRLREAEGVVSLICTVAASSISEFTFCYSPECLSVFKNAVQKIAQGNNPITLDEGLSFVHDILNYLPINLKARTEVLKIFFS